MKDKPLYIISIVAEILDVHPQTLRQYERLGLIEPSRTVGNTRLYSEEDVDKLKFIMTLTKELGVNLAGVEVIMNMKDQIEQLQDHIQHLTEFIKKQMGEEFKPDNENTLVPAPSRNIIKVKIEKG